MNKTLKQVLAYVIVGAAAPIVGNAAGVATSIISGDPSAHFTFASCITPALAPMLGTVPAVLAALIAKYAGHPPQLPAAK